LPGVFEQWKRFALVARRRRFEFKFHVTDQRIFKTRQQLRKRQDNVLDLRAQVRFCARVCVRVCAFLLAGDVFSFAHHARLCDVERLCASRGLSLRLAASAR
jgi:hypothetical protein